ncbi:hypothetical protein C7459_1053 [Tumebacillus permanentifrigoris]|uniref:Uncharacterized protein n=1 Tax=Tumebacillus permanentifrigoris TaxID=378543 RepID=A0A316DB96_9BACL|nr:hypothetical protein C7459_1053 [Tumebacillus permanentifrigoris]
MRYAWLQATTIAENVRETLKQAWRDQSYDLQFKDSKVYFDTQKTLPSKEKLNPSPEEHLPRLNRVLERIPTEYGTVVFYSKQNDEENMYAGFISKTEQVYDLVPVSSLLVWELSSAEIVKLLNQSIPFLRIQGAYGSNTIRTYYYRMDREYPQLLLEVDGTIHEVDIDNDQDKEIISVWGIPSITKIHTWEENRFQEANVTLNLKAESVMPVEREGQVLFDAYREPPQAADGQRPEGTTATTPTTYKYENGKMVPVS